MELIIFTDLDGTLLNQEDYDYRPAIPILEKLKAQNIPVIPVTSKTKAEVEGLRQEIGLEDPFIVENGSGIFVANGDRRFGYFQEKEEKPYHLKLLGCTYQEARAGLKAISRDLGEDVRGFGDLTQIELQSLTGLPLKEVELAQIREFTEPFITPDYLPKTKIEEIVTRYKLRVLVGDRFSHLLGINAGKGKAVQWLIDSYRARNPVKSLVTVGLGNSPNDLEMLEAVDIPVVIASKKGVHPDLATRGWNVPNSPGAQGWAEAVKSICQSLTT